MREKKNKQWDENNSSGEIVQYCAMPFILFRFFVLSGLGIFMFFIPVRILGKKTIPLDHIVSGLVHCLPVVAALFALLMMGAGIIWGVVALKKQQTMTNKMLLGLKLLGLIVGILVFSGSGPGFLLEKDMGPFLFTKLVIPVGLIVPVGAIFLSFLVDYGLLEFVGVLMTPVMRPVFRTPGRSAIDAVASFVGSYSIGLLITDKVFREGKYSIREAAIIATGFSTVSATFMVIVAKTLQLMPIWNTYFWTTLGITFVVTALSVRIRPLSGKSSAYFENRHSISPGRQDKKLLFAAWQAGINSAATSGFVFRNLWRSFRDGLKMAGAILPSIMSIGLIGLLLARFTPVFDIAGYVFLPVMLLFHLPAPMLAAKAAALSISEMFLPVLLIVHAPLVTRFVIAVLSVSSILFFSASIPCILATKIPLSIREIVMIWIERVILTLLLVIPLAFFLLK